MMASETIEVKGSESSLQFTSRRALMLQRLYHGSNRLEIMTMLVSGIDVDVHYNLGRISGKVG